MSQDLSDRSKSSADFYCTNIILHVSSAYEKIDTSFDPTQDRIKFQESKEEYLIAPCVRTLETFSYFFPAFLSIL